MSDIKPASHSAILFVSPQGGGGGYVGIDLLTGKLFAHKPEPQPPDMICPSPSGRLRIRDFEEGGFAVETSAGKLIKTLKRNQLAYSLGWSADESSVFYDFYDPESDEKTGVYVFSIKDKDSRLLIPGDVESFGYSPDNRRIAFNLKKSSLDKFGVLTILDGRSYKKVRSEGSHVNTFTFSPNGKRIAFTELVKDEYGDLSSTSLRVLDLETGRTTILLTNRRKPLYVWAGDDALLVSTKDKFTVPSVSLITISGKTTVLTTNRNAGFIRPFAYLPSRKRAVYKVTRSTYEYEAPEELWAVEPGHAPVRLFPVKGAGHE